MKDFFKKNWFVIALSVLGVFALVRKMHWLESGQKTGTISSEKFTGAGMSISGLQSLNLFPSMSKGQADMPEIDAAQSEAFLRRFGRVCVAEHKKFGIPASVLLAHAYVASFAGQRNVASEANNYTAIPCIKDWEGPTASFDGACFRKYNTPWESFRDFSIYLVNTDWIVETKKSAQTDWEKWVKAFDRHQISDVNNYEASMRSIIKAYRLFELDE